jgi:hypothetical protein
MRLSAPMLMAHLGTRPDHDPLSDGRVALAFLQAGAAQGDPVIQGHIPPDLGRLTDDHTHAMVNEQTGGEAGTRMDLNAGQAAGQLGEQACHGLQVVLP